MMLAQIRGQLLELILLHPLLERLVSASLELALVAAVVTLAIWCFRIRSPRVRALLWLVVLAKPVLALAVGSLVPLATLSSYYRYPSPESAQTALDAARERAGAVVGLSAKRELPDGAAISGVADQPAGDRETLKVPIPRALPPEFHVVAWRSDLPHVLLWGWIAGVVGLSILAIVGRLRLRRMVARAPAPQPDVVGAAASACKRVQVSRCPALHVTPELESPALAGWFRPVILLPAWLVEEGRAPALDWALRHELTHLKHRDPLANDVRRLAEILFFFHPAVWWASRQWALSAELACDRALVESEPDVTHYAEQLCVMLAEARHRRR